MTYSCAVFDSPEVGLAAAQAAKHELVLRPKLGLPLRACGCSTSVVGGGSMAIHAAAGTTASGWSASPCRRQQHEWATKQVVEHRDSVTSSRSRLQDYREVDDGTFDAISSIGMFEHVGATGVWPSTSSRLHALLRPGGRLLNHAIGRPGRGAGDTVPTRSAPRHTGWVSPPASGGPRGSPARSWTATSSPTGSSTRSGRWSR